MNRELLELARREAFALAESPTQAETSAQDATRAAELERLLRQLPPEWQRRYHLARIG